MVIVSNGFSKFHIAVAAAEADRRHLLTSFLTGAYPTPWMRRILALPYLRASAKLSRLVARKEDINEHLVHAFFYPEALHALGMLCRSKAMDLGSYRSYGASAVRHVRRAAQNGARIYHYRAGFGGRSVAIAKSLGMVALCDHSIAHPALVEPLVENAGIMPALDQLTSIDPFWVYILQDIEQADAVLVNSHFVKDTFDHVGNNQPPVHVIYWGVDDDFLTKVPRREPVKNNLRVLFAGTFERRKGVEALAAAVKQLDHLPWELEVAGPIKSGAADEYRDFFANPKVKYLGLLSRRDLAVAMSRADVFLFPSFAEGSARVVFEALACGCFIITTPNSGSIVEDGVHGALIPPGDDGALTQAIADAYRHRERTAAIGQRNAELIRTSYRQNNYGDRLAELYRSLLGGAEGHRQSNQCMCEARS